MVSPELAFPSFSVLRLLRKLGYKLAPEVEFTKASLWVPTPLVLSIVLGTVPVCVEQRDKIMSKRTLESSFIVTFLCSFCLVTLLGSLWPSDRRASGQEAAATAVDPWNVNAEVQRAAHGSRPGSGGGPGSDPLWGQAVRLRRPRLRQAASGRDQGVRPRATADRAFGPADAPGQAAANPSHGPDAPRAVGYVPWRHRASESQDLPA